MASRKTREGQATVGRSAVPSFTTLAKQRRFDDLVDVLMKNGPELKTWLLKSSSSRSSTPYLLLHSILQLQPPLKLVDLLIQRLTELFPYADVVAKDNSKKKSTASSSSSSTEATSSAGGKGVVAVIAEEVVNAHGQTPLHVACEYDCSVAVIQRLLAGPNTSSPCRSRDRQGRLPLHWAAVCSRSSANPSRRTAAAIAVVRKSLFFFGKKKQQQQSPPPSNSSSAAASSCSATQSADKNRLAVVSALVAADPTALCVEDMSGMTPLDLARKEQQQQLRQQQQQHNKRGGTHPPTEQATLQESNDSGALVRLLERFCSSTNFSSSSLLSQQQQQQLPPKQQQQEGHAAAGSLDASRRIPGDIPIEFQKRQSCINPDISELLSRSINSLPSHDFFGL